MYLNKQGDYNRNLINTIVGAPRPRYRDNLSFNCFTISAIGVINYRSFFGLRLLISINGTQKWFSRYQKLSSTRVEKRGGVKCRSRSNRTSRLRSVGTSGRPWTRRVFGSKSILYETVAGVTTSWYTPDSCRGRSLGQTSVASLFY